MRSTRFILPGLFCFVTMAGQAHAAEEPLFEEGGKEAAELEAKKQEQLTIEVDNALNEARLAKELAGLQAEIRRLMLEKEAISLRWELAQEQSKRKHEEEMLALRQEGEKLRAEVAVSQARVEKILEQFNAASVELHNKMSLLKLESEHLRAEVDQFKVTKKRASYAGGAPTYLKEPLQQSGSLVISDRRIDLNGVITPWRGNYIADRIEYFNNKDATLPIFIVIENSPGGSVMAGFHILKAMQHSQAPVYVVVKSFAASMAACLTTLADKSYAYPNAMVLHHQPWTFAVGNVRELGELYEEMKELWSRLGGPIAKKMGISLKELDKRLYVKSARGDWAEFADNAKKLKWVDHTISGIRDSGARELPEATDYTFEKYLKEYFLVTEDAVQSKDAALYLPLLGPKDFYYLYNPDNRYQMRPVK
ncbi:MAG: ATP-dependent Clp protease proteolytic subunit [Roseivirga sp.]